MPYSRPISIWESTALGKKSLSLPKQNDSTQQEREQLAKDITRYVLLDLVGWTEEEAVEHITPSIAKTLHLDKVFRNTIKFPPDCAPKDWDYKVAYALDYKYDVKRQLVRYWEDIVKGEIKKFPKRFFEGPRGQEKAAYLLNEFISRNIAVEKTADTPEAANVELYKRFADYASINAALKKAEIYDVCQRLYSNPLEYLHYSLSKERRSNLLFGFYEFRNVYMETMGKKNKGEAKGKKKKEE